MVDDNPQITYKYNPLSTLIIPRVFFIAYNYNCPCSTSIQLKTRGSSTVRRSRSRFRSPLLLSLGSRIATHAWMGQRHHFPQPKKVTSHESQIKFEGEATYEGFLK